MSLQRSVRHIDVLSADDAYLAAATFPDVLRSMWKQQLETLHSAATGCGDLSGSFTLDVVRCSWEPVFIHSNLLGPLALAEQNLIKT